MCLIQNPVSAMVTCTADLCYLCTCELKQTYKIVKLQAESKLAAAVAEEDIAAQDLQVNTDAIQTAVYAFRI